MSGVSSSVKNAFGRGGQSMGPANSQLMKATPSGLLWPLPKDMCTDQAALGKGKLQISPASQDVVGALTLLHCSSLSYFPFRGGSYIGRYILHVIGHQLRLIIYQYYVRPCSPAGNGPVPYRRSAESLCVSQGTSEFLPVLDVPLQPFLQGSLLGLLCRCVLRALCAG